MYINSGMSPEAFEQMQKFLQGNFLDQQERYINRGSPQALNATGPPASTPPNPLGPVRAAPGAAGADGPAGQPYPPPANPAAAAPAPAAPAAPAAGLTLNMGQYQGAGGQAQVNALVGQQAQATQSARNMAATGYAGVMSPDDLAKHISGTYRYTGYVSPEDRARALTLYLGQLGGASDNAKTQGQLGIQQQQTDLEKTRLLGQGSTPGAMQLAAQEMQMKQATGNAALTQQGRRAAYESAMLQQGKTPEEVSSLVKRLDQGGLLKGDLGTTGSATTPATAAGYAGVPAAATPSPSANSFDDIRHELDPFAQERADKPGTMDTKIGEFLTRLNSSKAPGYVEANFPKIEAYIKARWGNQAWESAAKGMKRDWVGNTVSPDKWYDGLPGVGLLRRSVEAVGHAASGLSDDENGRQMLGNYLRSKGR